MSTFDIRKEEQEITCIIFSDTGQLNDCLNSDWFQIEEEGVIIAMKKEDIPNLQKALAKALEIW